MNGDYFWESFVSFCFFGVINSENQQSLIIKDWVWACFARKTLAFWQRPVRFFLWTRLVLLILLIKILVLLSVEKLAEFCWLLHSD